MTTKKLVPRASGEGAMGVADNAWGEAYYDTGNFNKGLFVKGSGIEDVIANTVTQGGLGGEWTRNGLDIYYNGGNVGIGTTSPSAALDLRRPNTATNSPAIMMGKDPRSSHGNMIIQGQIIGVHYDESGLSTVPGGASRVVFGNGDWRVERSTSTAVGVARTWETRLKILDNGNVGIGTTDPGVFKTLFNNSDANTLVKISSGKDEQASLFFGEDAGGGATPAWLQRYGSTHATKPNKLELGAVGTGSWVAIQGDSNDVLNIRGDGNVGIGTTSPSGKLHVKINSVTPTSLGQFENPDGQALLRIKAKSDSYSILEMADAEDGNVGAVWYDHSNNSMRFKTNDSEKVRILSNGNVGIGTTSPAVKLDVQGSNADGDVRLSVANTSDEQGALTLLLLGNDEYPGGSAGFRRYSSTHPKASVLDIANLEAGKHITFSTRSGTAEEERMRINSDGNVGIGTTNPLSNLVVHDGTNNTATSFEINCSDNSTLIESLQRNNSNNPSPIRYIGASHNFLGSTGGSGGAGNVGIGTTDPGAKLHIQGDDDEAYSPNNRLQRNGATLFVYNTSEVNDSYSQLVLGNRTPNGSMSRIVSVLLQPGQSELSFSTTKGTIQQESMAISSDGVKVNNLSASSSVQTDANGYFTTTSDKRLKNDLGDCEYGLNEVLQVQPKRYTWKDGPKDANPTVGFFAQDVHDVMPEAAPREAIQNEKGEDDYKWGFHSQTIIAALVNATKEQQQLIEDLRSEVEALKNK